ncbi:DUF2798 domain-containing protein [Rhodopseudomonas telluris]|uniref:DUF2798 domain-containing protein n=1 Tax=Rhodopseudomonas telluris TaxID=644215 RepID=A0ABV6ETT6_9BRAD
MIGGSIARKVRDVVGTELAAPEAIQDKVLMAMLGIPRRFSHFVYAILQSGITTSVASLIASAHLLGDTVFVTHWLTAWAASWMVMLPIVLFAAPVLRRLTLVLTTDD